MPTTHKVKSWPEFFEPVWNDEKMFELRYNDRNYKVGDIIVLQEWEPKPLAFGDTGGRYTGREATRRITYVMTGAGNVGVIEPCKGLSMGYCILSLEDVE